MVIVSESWMKNGEYDNYVEMSENAAKAVLICRPNSHPFQERTLSLEQPVKVGRSVARARASAFNAIFDCKVLSRHHALLAYQDGKFYLQDTKSSNGTFVNNNRLSSNEFDLQEVSSGDIVQFGVDVVENNRKVTHGCIVATLKLFLPDGKEAKASASIAETKRHSMVPLDELYKLNQIIQEASQRELCLETKLTALQHVVDAARHSADESWQAYIGEERLLSRVAALETQLAQAGKALGDDRLRDELEQLQEDRSAYQVAAKAALMKAHDERLAAVAAAAEQERARASAENEVMLAKENWERAQDELQELANKLTVERQKADDERERYELRIKEMQTTIEYLLQENDKENEGKEEPEPDPDPQDAVLKYERILNDDIKGDEHANEIILTAPSMKEEPVENKDELTTSKEQTNADEDEEDDEVLSDTDTDNSVLSTVTTSEVDMQTLKYNYQTVAEQKRQIEQLEVLSASNKTRIALLERSLLNEKEEKSYMSSRMDALREEHAVLQAQHAASVAEALGLSAQLADLELQRQETQKAVTVDVAAQSDDGVDELEAEKRRHLLQLEEEVVLLKERFAAAGEEKLALNKELVGAHDKYNALCNRSHNTLFFYVAPLALMVLYLLVSSMFS